MDDIEQLANHQGYQLDEGWLDHLHDATVQTETQFWSSNPRKLVTQSKIHPQNFMVGNGADIYKSTILPNLESTNHEIIFVTCFWARSRCLTELGETLIKLSQKASAQPKDTPRLRVRLCFSSRSLTQKLFHTSSTDGFVYKASQWASDLGLPPPDALSGLDLQVKSLFFLPFSVMHPKFVIIDRKIALLPSCNLSYESWFEGCLTLTGPIVDRLLSFWKDVWGLDESPSLYSHPSPTRSSISRSFSFPARTTILLPSPHHRSPSFRPFLSAPSPPPTPLNTYITQLFATATSSITILTPNLTCQHVIHCLLSSLSRGVNVTIITNRRMMVLEQLFTAGTLTEICVSRLKKRYNCLIAKQKRSSPTDADLETGLPEKKVGTLEIGYFRAGVKYKKSHFKCTVVDRQRVVLGSGNMDRASWFTSQELGLAIHGEDVVKQVMEEVWAELGGRESEGRRSECVEWV